MWTAWAVNLVSFLLIVNFVWREFNQRTVQEIKLSQIANEIDTINIQLSKSRSDDVLNRLGNLLVVGDEMLSEEIELNIRPSQSNEFELNQWNYARGRSSNESDELIEKISYPVQVEGNTITLPANFSIPQGTKWRDQSVRLTLKVPQGKKVNLDRSTRAIDVWVDKDRSVDHPSPVDGRVWEMRESGMVCPEHIAQTNYFKTWPERDFTKVQVEGRVGVEIRRGNEFAVKVKGRQDRADQVEVFKIGNTLNVSSKLRRHHHDLVILDITMPSLQELDVEGTNEVVIRGFKEKEMAIRHEGDHKIKAHIDVDSLRIHQEGHNEMQISGTGRFLEADVSSGARLNTERFPVMVADLKASKRGFVKANVRQFLHREIDERSRVEVEGNPKIKQEGEEEASQEQEQEMER